jgi:hypothetical protein
MMRRGALYARLADYLGYEGHVGSSNIEQRKAIIEAATAVGGIKSERG